MIRKFAKKDITPVCQMIHTYLDISHEYVEFDEDRTLKALHSALEETNNIYVIVDDEDTAIGYINFHIINFPLISGKEFYISELIVHEGERSKNLGTRLINFAITRAKELGCERLMLNNSMESISYKRNFYKNLGFAQRDTMANFVLKINE